MIFDTTLQIRQDTSLQRAFYEVQSDLTNVSIHRIINSSLSTSPNFENDEGCLENFDITEGETFHFISPLINSLGT